MDRINHKQITIIKIAQAQLGLSDETYRQLLTAMYKVSTCKDLTYLQADRLIDHLKKLGFKIRTNRCRAMCQPRERGIKLPDNVLVLVSPQQLSMIEHLRQDIHWNAWNGFDLWLAKFYGVQDGIRGIKDSLTATRVIEGLKGFWKSQNCNCKRAAKRS